MPSSRARSPIRSIRLTIVTALSLRKPRGRSDLERRLVEPLAQRVFGGYPELEYVRLIEQGRLPDNIEVVEFFLEPGAWLNSAPLQQNYLSSNYTHVARDALKRGLNVHRAAGRASAGRRSAGRPAEPRRESRISPPTCCRRSRRCAPSGQPFALIGQVHGELPFMYGDALVAADTFDFLLDDPGTRAVLSAERADSAAPSIRSR